MAPQGPTQKHEAAELLTDWERFGCPTKTGRDWTLAEIQAAIDCGPHKSALEPDAIKHFADEVTDKVAKGQVRVIFSGTISRTTAPTNSRCPRWQQSHTNRKPTGQSWTYRLRYGRELPQ